MANNKTNKTENKMKHSIEGIGNEQYVISEIRDASSLESLSLPKRNLENNIYMMNRVLDGRKTKQHQILCYRRVTGEFVSMI